MNRKRRKQMKKRRRRRREGCLKLLMLRLKPSHFLSVLSPLPVFVGFTCCLLFFLCGASPQEDTPVWTNWSYWDFKVLCGPESFFIRKGELHKLILIFDQVSQKMAES